MKAFTIPAIFTAIDKLTSPVEKMAKSIGDLGDAGEEAAARIQRRFRKLGDASQEIAKQTAISAALIAAPFLLAAKEATTFEDKMADVAKVLNQDIGSENFAKTSQEAKDLAYYLARDATEAAGLMASLAQGGVAENELERVSKIAGQVAVAFGMQADEAGDRFIKMRNALGESIEETAKVADAINYLSDTSASSASQILDFMSAGGAGVARALGASGPGIAAFGAQLISVGKEGAEAGTIIERFSKGILENGDIKSIFDKAGGGLSGMMAVLEHGSKLNPDKQFAFFQKFGQYGTDIRLLSQNYGQLSDLVSSASNDQLIAGSVLNEFNSRQNTTAVRLQRVRVQMQLLAIEVGEKLLPVINELVSHITPIIQGIINWVKENPALTKTISVMALGLSALLLTISGISWAVWAVSKAMMAFTYMSRLATAAQWLWNLAMTANPIGLIIASIILLIGAIALVIAKWNDWGAALSLFMGPLGAIISMIQAFRRNWDMITEAFSKGGILEGLKAIGVTLLDSFIMPLQQVLKLISRFTGAEWANEAVKGFDMLRKNIRVNVSTDENGEPLPGNSIPAVNPELRRQESLKEVIRETTNNSRVSFDVNDPFGILKQRSVSSDNPSLMPKLSSTMGW